MNSQVTNIKATIEMLKRYCQLRPREEFANDVLAAYRTYGFLTPRQERAVKKMLAGADFDWLEEYSKNEDSIVSKLNDLSRVADLTASHRQSIAKLRAVVRSGFALGASQVSLVDEIAESYGLGGTISGNHPAPSGNEATEDEAA